MFFCHRMIKKKHFRVKHQKVKLFRANEPILSVFMWGINHTVSGQVQSHLLNYIVFYSDGMRSFTSLVSFQWLQFKTQCKLVCVLAFRYMCLFALMYQFDLYLLYTFTTAARTLVFRPLLLNSQIVNITRQGKWEQMSNIICDTGVTLHLSWVKLIERVPFIKPVLNNLVVIVMVRELKIAHRTRSAHPNQIDVCFRTVCCSPHQVAKR